MAIRKLGPGAPPPEDASVAAIPSPKDSMNTPLPKTPAPQRPGGSISKNAAPKQADPAAKKMGAPVAAQQKPASPQHEPDALVAPAPITPGLTPSAPVKAPDASVKPVAAIEPPANPATSGPAPSSVPKPQTPKASQAPKVLAPKPQATETPKAMAAPGPASSEKPAAHALKMDATSLQKGLLKIAEQSVTQSYAALDQATTAANEATLSFGATLQASSKNATDLTVKALEMARANAIATFDHMVALSSVKNVSDAIALQGEFLRKQSEKAMAQAREFSELAKKVAIESATPLQKSKNS